MAGGSAGPFPGPLAGGAPFPFGHAGPFPFPLPLGPFSTAFGGGLDKGDSEPSRTELDSIETEDEGRGRNAEELLGGRSPGGPFAFPFPFGALNTGDSEPSRTELDSIETEDEGQGRDSEELLGGGSPGASICETMVGLANQKQLLLQMRSKEHCSGNFDRFTSIVSMGTKAGNLDFLASQELCKIACWSG